MKRVGLVLKIVGVVALTMTIFLGVAAVMLNNSSVQNRMMGYVTGLLQERLNTQVKIDSVYVNFLTQNAVLMGLEVEDQQQRKMICLDHLSANFGLWDLLRHTITISNVEIKGVRASLYKEEGLPANYQFVIDAFKKKPDADNTAPDSTKKDKLQLNIKDFRLADVEVQYNEDICTSLSLLTMDKRRKRWLVNVDSLRYRYDNHLPRKNEGNPSRGYFDTGHLDVVASLRLSIDHVEKDSVHAEMTQCCIIDSVMGVNLKDLRFKVGVNPQTVHLADVVIQHENTTLQFADGELRLPSKKTGATLEYSTSEIKGRTVLKDISRPFAPVLTQFVMPLNLCVKLSGTDSTMTFKDIKVTTDDQRLSIAASGGIKHLTDKERLDIRFHVDKMTAKGNVKREIINQFAVKKFMMKQLDALGTIGYMGDISILRKRETFSGQLRTAVGTMNFTLALNGATQYVSGSISTSNLQLGKALDVPDIGKVAGNATFKFDYSVSRTKKIRRQLGGKLPIGSVQANIDEAHYKKLNMKNIFATVESDGAKAQGNITQKNKHVDLLCSFSFDNTDALRKMKIKPGVKINTFEKLGKQIEEKMTKVKQKKTKKAKKAKAEN